MGFFDKLQAALGYQQKEARILLVGLDNSGKTTMIQHLKPQETSVMEVVPTVGFQVEEFKRKGVKFTIFDMSGQDKYRSIWENYYQDVQAIIFVIDCADKIRWAVVRGGRWCVWRGGGGGLRLGRPVLPLTPFCLHRFF
jgi:ADP-ribosylation factor-like protein 6